MCRAFLSQAVVEDLRKFSFKTLDEQEQQQEKSAITLVTTYSHTFVSTTCASSPLDRLPLAFWLHGTLSVTA
jgi:hypothetical protein